MNLRTSFASLMVGGLLVSGCSQQTLHVASAATPAATEIPAAPPTKPFAAETLYALLVAEFAGNRERYDIALGNYMQQARRTRDPGIAARATHIAHFLGVHPAILAGAELWLDIEPDNMEARFLLANEQALLGQLDDALQHSIILLDSGSTPVFQTIAAQASKLPEVEHQQLLATFQHLLDTHPQEQQLLIGTGLLLQQEQSYSQALEMARRALDQDPQSVSAAILESRLLQQLERPQEALTSLSQRLALQPDNQRLRLQYARLLASYDIDGAYEQFTLLAEENPDDPDLVFSLALVSLEIGHIEEAKNEFERLLDSNSPHESSAHFYLGRIARQQNDPPLALLHYKDVEPGPDFLPANLQIGDILISQNQLNIAAAHFQKVRDQFPELAPRLYLLEAEILTEHGHGDLAETRLSEALTAYPGTTQLLYARAMLNADRGKIASAESDLRSILSSEPGNATTLNALGYTLANHTQRFDEAYALINQAIQLRPDDPAILDSLGWVQYRLGKIDDSLLRLRQAMQLSPDHEIAAHLGEVLWVSGNREEAQTVWKQGLELRPDSPVIHTTIQRLTGQDSLP